MVEFKESIKLYRNLCSLLKKTEKIRKTTSHGPTKDMLRYTIATLHEALFQLGQSAVE